MNWDSFITFMVPIGLAFVVSGIINGVIELTLIGMAIAVVQYVWNDEDN